MPDFVDEQIDTLVYWMHEREAIRLAKEAGKPKPWTRDPLLRDYRWCNVQRNRDAVSIELLTRWYRTDDPCEALVAAALGRLFNWPESLFEVTEGAPFNMGHLPRFEAVLKARAARGCKVFTGAFVVPALPGRANKIESVLELVGKIRDDAPRIMAAGSMKGSWQALQCHMGLKSFLAGQICADIASITVGSMWPDRTTWAALGPGSMRGLNRLMGREKETTITQDQFEVLLLKLIDVVHPRIADLAIAGELLATDWQSALCEVDKLIRLQHDEGRVRARYDGRLVKVYRQTDLFADT